MSARLLEWRVRLLSVGAVLALVGLALDDRRITGGAIIVLGLGIGVRLFAGRAERGGMERGGMEREED
jgi:hypothetical protein